MTYTIGNVLDVLPTLEAGRFRCCVTSPPYWGLRDYGHPDQLGLEATPAEYVERMVRVFREVRRVLADDGTLWLNLGDSYVTKPHGAGSTHDPKWPGGRDRGEGKRANRAAVDGLKHKDLVGIPWMVAFALRADGWFLRGDIIWAKPNPMPDPTRDRTTRSHEYVFHLAKSADYYYDAAAIAEKAISRAPAGNKKRRSRAEAGGIHDDNRHQKMSVPWSGVGGTRNARSVWTITPRPFKGAHFAVMPPPLAERCIRAGSAVGDEVLDPFLGSGTVGMVCEALGRRWFGVELQSDYAPLIEQRTARGPLLRSAAC